MLDRFRRVAFRIWFGEEEAEELMRLELEDRKSRLRLLKLEVPSPVIPKILAEEEPRKQELLTHYYLNHRKLLAEREAAVQAISAKNQLLCNVTELRLQLESIEDDSQRAQILEQFDEAERTYQVALKEAERLKEHVYRMEAELNAEAVKHFQS